MRLGGFVLEDVRVTGRHGGIDVRVDEIGVRASLLSLASDGASAVEAIGIRGARAEVDLSHSGAERSFAEIREAVYGGSGSDGATDSRVGSDGRAIAVTGLQVTAVDGFGPLLRVVGGEASLSGGDVRVGADEIEVGGGDGHRVALGGLEARLRRAEDGTLQVASASAAGGEVVWARPATAGSPPEDEPSAQEPPATLSRLLSLASSVRPSSDDETEDRGDRATEPGLLGRLASGASLRLADATVRTRTGEGEEIILRGLHAALGRRDQQTLHFEGAGTSASGGSLTWDLSLEPLALRAEGTISFTDLPLALVAPLLSDVPWHEPEHGRLDGELTVAGEAAEPLSIRGRLALRSAALYAPRIAPEPVTDIEATVEGEGTWRAESRRLEVRRATVTMGRASLEVAGALEWTPDHYLVDVTATLPSTDCGTAVSAIPRDLLADLAGFSWQGRIGGRLVASVDSRRLEETELDIDVSDACQFETVPAVADLRRFQSPFLHTVLEPDGTWFEMTTGPGTGSWTSIFAMSPFFIQAVLAHEDASFFRHGGFAPWAIRSALVRNLAEGRYVVGASTITMQLAKNLFLHREKTLARKVQEVLLAWWLESALEKRDILELYLNVIEYGPGVYGIRHAAQHYFGRDPSELSPAESAFLANILPNPKLYHGQYERGELSSSMRNRVQRFLHHMHARGRIDDEALEYGLAEIETFAFYHEGSPLPAPRELAGSTAELPFATGSPLWDESWEDWADEPFEEGSDLAP